MQVSVLESGKKKVMIELGGEDHTFANVLTKKLTQDKNAEGVAYRISHPLNGRTEVLMRTDEKTAKIAFKKAAAAIEEDAKEFGKKFAAAYKKK